VIGTKMALEIIIKREIRDTVLSRRFIIYLILLLLPLVLNIWFCWMMYEDPSILQQMTAMFPEPLTEVNPTICLMSYVDIVAFPIALIAVLHSSDFIAGEKERGMLTLLVSKPLHRWEIIIGKLFSSMVIFIPLLTLNFLVMVLSFILIGIGIADLNILVGYLTVILFYAIVILDFLTIYLPKNTADVINNISLSHHVNILLGFISGGEAGIFVKGGIPSDPNIGAFIYSFSMVVLILSIMPILLSVFIFKRKDIQNK
jgi:ABC-type transport system involved in multi-copper enzyme maturation permease subunit